MKRNVIVLACAAVLAVFTGCSTLSSRQEPANPDCGFSELRANNTYFGKLATRNGASLTGFVTWEPQHEHFIIRVYRPTAITLKMPSREVVHLRFRDLSADETKMIENQNTPLHGTAESRKDAAPSVP